MKNYTKQIIERNIDELSNELKSMWLTSSSINKHTMSFLDNLSDVSYTVFNRIYKNIDGSWSKSAIAGELIKGNKLKVLRAIK